jgi:hypothetical protein
MAELEEGGSKTEDFWGLYAREEIAFRLVALYNVVILSPLLALFIGWVRGSMDMQNASVPIMMVTGILSVFWACFLSTTSMGKVNGP